MKSRAPAILLAAALLLGVIVVTPAGFQVTAYATSVNGGTAMAFAPDGRLFVCEQAGLLEVYGPTGAYIGTFHDFTGNISTLQERGLLGVAFDPDFAANGFVYVYRTRATPSIRNQVVRLVANGNVSDTTEFVILDLEDLSATNHNGGAIHFGTDGKLYVAQGENAVPANAQLLTNRFGKILRINPNGTIPADNPTTFPGIAGSPAGLNQSIWAVGLRNPFTFAVDPVTGRIFINDVGASINEEINDGIAGSNYGWTTAGIDGPQGNANFVDPVYSYTHADPPPNGVSITGGTFYNPPVPQFPASYVGKYFFADVGGGWIYVLDPMTGVATEFSSGTNQIVDLDVGPDGALYVLDRLSSSVRRVAYTGTTTQAIILSSDALSVDENGSGTVGVRLAVDPGAPVTVNVALLLSDPTVSVSPPTLTFTSGDFATYQDVTVSAAADADFYFEGGTVTLSSPGLPDRTVTVTVIDDEPAGGWPLAEITLPKNGHTVSGDIAEFFGEVSNGVPTTSGEFFVDGVSIYTDAGAGHYHVGGGHASWDTTALANGVHVLRLVVTDGVNSGGHEITVLVNNPVPPPVPGESNKGRCGLTGFEVVVLFAVAARFRKGR